MWMGGNVPLGYDVRDRKLVVNEAEAQIVRHILQRYIALESVPALIEELARDGIRSKARLRPDGASSGGKRIGRGGLYHLLSNRLYRGEITTCALRPQQARSHAHLQ
jgi:hypothetical protein